MVGMATLTMLISRIDMNIPAISTVNGSPQPAGAPAPGATPPALPCGRFASGTVTPGRLMLSTVPSERRVLYFIRTLGVPENTRGADVEQRRQDVRVDE